MRQLFVFSSWLFLLLLPRASRCEGEYQTVYACEGTTLELQCRQSEVIELVRANFGRFSITICNTLGNTNWTVKCMTPNSLRVLQKSCGISSRCLVPISTDRFGDACPGTSKYIEVQYRCVTASSTTTTKRPLPPWHDLYPDPSIWLQEDPEKEQHEDSDSSRGSTQAAVSSTTETWTAGGDSTSTTSAVADASVSVQDSADHSSEASKVEDLEKSQQDNAHVKGLDDLLDLHVDEPKKEFELENRADTSTRFTLLPASTSEVYRSDWLPKFPAGDEFVYTPPPPSYSLPPSTSSSSPPLYDQSHHNHQQQGRHQSRIFTEPYHSGRHAQNSNPTAAPPSHCHWTSARGLLWPSTSANSQAILPCPRGATGRARWLCDGSTGRWARPTPDLSDCHSPAVSGLEHELLSGKTGPLGVAAQLTTATRPHDQPRQSPQLLLGGDVRLVSRLSGELAAALAAQLVEDHAGGPERSAQMARQLVTSVLQMTSNLLDVRHRAAWYDLAPTERVQTATRLMIGLEQVAFLLSDYMLADNSIAELTNHLYLSVLSAPNRKSAEDFVFPLVSPLGEWRSKGNSLRLPSSTALDENFPSPMKIVFLIYDGLEHVLQPESLPDAPVRYVINSAVISASLGEGRHVPIPRPVTIVLRHLANIPSDLTGGSAAAAYKLSCRYWDYAATAWLADGCWLLESNTTHTTCQCNHLTHFAVLMEVRRSGVETAVMADDETAVRVVVYVGGAIAVLCLSFALLAVLLATSAGVTAAVSSSAGSWHHGGHRLHYLLMKHLLAALLLAELCYFLGLHQTSHRVVCGLLAGSLQFFLLAALVWHALDQLHVYTQLVPAVAVPASGGGMVAARGGSRCRCFCAVGYTLPLLVVAVSCAVDASSYGSPRHCWLVLDNYFVLSFAAPASICVLCSLCLLALNGCLMRQQYETHVTMTTVSMTTVKQRVRSARMTQELGRSFLLLVALILFMITALAYLELKTHTTAYLFAAANTCLGVYSVVALAVYDPLVRLNLSEGCLQSCFHYSSSDTGGARSGTKLAVGAHNQMDVNGVGSGEVICASSGTINTMLQTADRSNVPQLWPAHGPLGKTGSLRSSTTAHPAHVAAAYSMRRGTVARTSNSMVLSSSAATAISAAPTLRNNIALTDVSSLEPGMDSGHGTGSEHEESPHVVFGNGGFRSVMNNSGAEGRFASATLGAGGNSNNNNSRWSTLHGYRAPTDLVYHPSMSAAYHTYVEVDRDPEYEEIGRQMMGHHLLAQPPPPPAPTSSWAHHPENLRRHHLVPTSMQASLPRQGYSLTQDQNVAVAMLDGENVVCRLQSQ